MTAANAYDFPLTPAQMRPVFFAGNRQLPESDTAHYRLQHILNVLPSGIILLDQKGIVSEANPVAIQMLGQPLVGQRWLEVITRCFRPRSDDGLEVSLKDGRRVQLAISALTPEPGQLIVLTDLTETRRLQSRIAHMQRLSVLGKMMASLAHQIRTPLSSAMLYAENLANPRLAVMAQQQFQQKLVARLQDLEHQVNDMLLFARSGTAQAVSPVTTQQLAEQIRAGSEALLLQHQAELLLDIPERPLWLLANLNSLAGAIQNLINNSLQIIPAGARLQLSMQLTADSDSYLRIRFQDNGPGIAPEVLPHIFEPFFTTRSQGTGLGLAVVQAVVASHQGSVQYISQPEGACFELLLPLHVSEPSAEESNHADN
ncbi:ATP-binding protein [Chromatiaceae bacterium AAb-1]|nr:ATP-binding protein [Chromatiaceae bacterium AAb-1]